VTEIAVNMGAAGIGDAILGLVAIGALKKANSETVITYKVSEEAMPFVALFDGGYDRLDLHDPDGWLDYPPYGPDGDLQLNKGYVPEVVSRIASPRWLRYCRNVGMETPVLPKVRDREKLLRKVGQEFIDTVVIAPFSAFFARDWRIDRWQTFIRMLRNAGEAVVATGNDPERLCQLPCRWDIGGAKRTAGILLGARRFIGLDSGLTHFAGALGVPALAICGLTRGDNTFGVWPSVQVIQGHTECEQCLLTTPRKPGGCEMECRAMLTITPEEVFARIDT
jgi:ADP-heptose:LPS heptosyltransferase